MSRAVIFGRGTVIEPVDREFAREDHPIDMTSSLRARATDGGAWPSSRARSGAAHARALPTEVIL